MHQNFGARMRRRREEQGITVTSIADQTKIKQSLLEALERDDTSRFETTESEARHLAADRGSWASRIVSTLWAEKSRSRARAAPVRPWSSRSPCQQIDRTTRRQRNQSGGTESERRPSTFLEHSGR